MKFPIHQKNDILNFVSSDAKVKVMFLKLTIPEIHIATKTFCYRVVDY